jgi:hypothetical protein
LHGSRLQRPLRNTKAITAGKERAERVIVRKGKFDTLLSESRISGAFLKNTAWMGFAQDTYPAANPIQIFKLIIQVHNSLQGDAIAEINIVIHSRLRLFFSDHRTGSEQRTCVTNRS